MSETSFAFLFGSRWIILRYVEVVVEKWLRLDGCLPS